MKNYAFARSFRFVLFCAFVAAGLLVTGCDSGSNGSPDWVGDWVNLDDDDIVYSITEDEIEIFQAFTAQGTTSCETTTIDITNVDGNEVTTEEPDGDEVTVTFNVDDGQLEIRPEDDPLIETGPIDEDPEQYLGCDLVN